MHDDEPTEEELRAAEELARALERGHAGPELPEDALGAAALLHYARHGAPLSERRGEAILSEALEGARSRRPRARRFFFLSALGLSMAAALVFLISRSSPTEPALLPLPPARLLQAELEMARSNAGSIAALGAEMRPYRESVYATLEERYRK